MSRLIETIRLLDGEFANLDFHRERMLRAWKELFDLTQAFKLEDALQSKPVPQTGLYKCRLIYGTELQKVEFVPYQARNVKSLKLVYDDAITYPHKFENRDVLNRHFNSRGPCDDVLIVKNGKVTDTTIASIAFRKGTDWLTPESCLLPGTTRQRLVNNKVIRIAPINADEISSFDAFKLLNSMVGWDGPEVNTSEIVA